MSGLPLEPSAADRDELSGGILEFLHRWIDARDGAPASWPEPDGALIDSLLRAPSVDGIALDQLLDAVGRAADTGFDTAGGAMLSYIPSGGLYTAALGGLVGSVTNQYTGGAHASPGMTAIEESVVRWMVALFGLPATGGGVLLSGGSMANQVAVVTARSKLGDDFRDGVVYCSTRTHHSVEKAARIAGIGADRVRLIASDEHRRLDMDALARQVAEDTNNGLRPMMIVANAGTTDTGAIDPLNACADIAAASGAWFHADAAYGGFFQLTERGRARLSGIERADSITVDAHKSLFLPFGVGGLLVRDRAAVVEAHQGRGAYMQDVPSTDLPHYMEMGPELTRPNRGLQVWLALNLHGTDRFRDELDRMLDLAEHAAARLASTPGVELLDAPELSVVALRAAAGDDDTRRLLDVLVSSREVHVSSTTIDDRVYVRLAFLSQRTTTAIADRAIELIASAASAD
ncbi:MAG: hypothetical protein DHS20C19_12660 [Acidimicrobiales bacterium]|nr:MAG: hypothetical protein DHS20C19_12660 [Acidimicrobiales bacterium]